MDEGIEDETGEVESEREPEIERAAFCGNCGEEADNCCTIQACDGSDPRGYSESKREWQRDDGCRYATE